LNARDTETGLTAFVFAMRRVVLVQFFIDLGQRPVLDVADGREANAGVRDDAAAGLKEKRYIFGSVPWR
jgi:hypothetical protein